jgi:aminoglycoside/choline kinase family phosphotransferase
VTPEAAAIGDRLCANIEAYIKRGGPRCLIHQDFRPDNMMFASAEGGYPVTTLDWQSIAYGPGATDVAYFLAGAISVEERREHEAALIGRYLEGLRVLGVTGYPRTDFMRDYALGSFQLFLTAFFAAMIVTQTSRGDDMFFQMMNSAVAQITDTSALELLAGKG